MERDRATTATTAAAAAAAAATTTIRSGNIKERWRDHKQLTQNQVAQQVGSKLSD